jgi:hypothetical protein
MIKTIYGIYDISLSKNENFILHSIGVKMNLSCCLVPVMFSGKNITREKKKKDLMIISNQ